MIIASFLLEWNHFVLQFAHVGGSDSHFSTNQNLEAKSGSIVGEKVVCFGDDMSFQKFHHFGSFGAKIALHMLNFWKILVSKPQIMASSAKMSEFGLLVVEFHLVFCRNDK